MDIKEKREALVGYFRQTLLDQAEQYKEADETQKELIDTMMEKTKFSLVLMEEGSAEFNGVKTELSDKKIEMMYYNYFENPS